MHHVFDETPDEMRELEAKGINDNKVGQFDIGDRVDTHAQLYQTHTGRVVDKTGDFPHHNLSQYRQRGYGVGSLVSEATDKDAFYKQPGHPLYEKGEDEENARFDVSKY